MIILQMEGWGGTKSFSCLAQGHTAMNSWGPGLNPVDTSEAKDVLEMLSVWPS